MPALHSAKEYLREHNRTHANDKSRRIIVDTVHRIHILVYGSILGASAARKLQCV